MLSVPGHCCLLLLDLCFQRRKGAPCRPPWRPFCCIHSGCRFYDCTSKVAVLFKSICTYPTDYVWGGKLCYNICTLYIPLPCHAMPVNALCNKQVTCICRYSFGTAVQVLPIPELMPFRLTRQMTGALQPHDALALLQAPCTLAMTALRSGKDILEVCNSISLLRFVFFPCVWHDFSSSASSFPTQVVCMFACVHALDVARRMASGLRPLQVVCHGNAALLHFQCSGCTALIYANC